MWETRIAIENDDKSCPVFKDIKIIDRRNNVVRSGATLEHEKGRSQVICSGEICIDDKISPFVVDLILDISYVSTTKCESVEIKPKNVSKIGKYTVIDCNVYIL